MRLAQNTRILVIPGPGVGDCIALLSVLHVLKQYRDDVILDVLAQPRTPIELFYNNPDIRYLHNNFKKKYLNGLAKNYDIAITFPLTELNFFYIKYLGLRTFIPEYGDCSHAQSAFNLIKFLFPECANILINKYYLFLQPEHFAQANQILLKAKIKLSDKEILIGCHIGYSSVAYKEKSFLRRWMGKFGSRAWPLKNYILLLEKLISYNQNIRFVLTGSAAETKIIKRLFKKYHRFTYNISGKTSVLNLACIMSYFKCFVSGDTGPMHIAAAMNIPLVTLFSEKTLNMGKITFAKQTSISSEKITDIAVDSVFSAVVNCIKNNCS